MLKKILVPIAILAFGVLLTATLVRLRPEVEKAPIEIPPPRVRVLEATSGDMQLEIRSQGTVEARTEAELVSEVSGAITWVSGQFEPGGFFRRGEVLLRVDPRDYELAVASAEAQLAQARVAMAREKAEAEIARDEWNEIGEGTASPLTLREPQLAEARARVGAAEAALAKTQLDLERTGIKAPFSGRLRSQRVDLGEFVNRGTPLATIYSVDRAEVRLPVPDSDLAYVDLPLGAQPGSSGPRVTLTTEFAGKTHSWEGRIVRTAGAIDPQTRMVDLIAQVANPYDTSNGRPPLSVGLFVDAAVEGKKATGVFEIPRHALKGNDRVAIIDNENKVHFKNVEVLRRTRDAAIIENGLETGDRVLLTTLNTVIEGMLVDPTTSPGGTGEQPVREIDVTLEPNSDTARSAEEAGA